MCCSISQHAQNTQHVPTEDGLALASFYRCALAAQSGWAKEGFRLAQVSLSFENPEDGDTAEIRKVNVLAFASIARTR